jgi:hypothetical protein
MEPNKIIELLKGTDVDSSLHTIIALDYIIGSSHLENGKQLTEDEWYALGLVEGLIEGGYEQ